MRSHSGCSSPSATNPLMSPPGTNAGFSWIIVHTSNSDTNKGKALAYLFKWLVTDGQSLGTDLQYAPLPTSVQALAMTNLKLIKAGGQPVLT